MILGCKFHIFRHKNYIGAVYCKKSSCLNNKQTKTKQNKKTPQVPQKEEIPEHISTNDGTGTGMRGRVRHVFANKTRVFVPTKLS